MVDSQEQDTRRGLDTESDDPTPDEADHEETENHRHHHHDVETVGVAILTVSSSRTLKEDPSGDAIETAVTAEGHDVVTRELVGDSYDSVQQSVDGLLRRKDVDLVISTGGTGITPDDVTIDAVRPLLSKRLPGFGELFRRRSEAEIGTRAIGTRATAGIANGVIVFCLPGSESAVTLGTEELILPEASHLVGLVQRGQEDAEDESPSSNGPE